jgi:hypothetical protein
VERVEASAAGPASPTSLLALQRAAGNRAVARMVADAATKEDRADRVALTALGMRGNRRMSVAQAVGAVTGTDVSGVPVRRAAVPGAAGVAKHGAVSIAPGADSKVLAHELAHVALGHDADGRAHHFVRSERPEIGNLDDLVSDARRMANAHSSAGLMRWGRFTAAAGGMAPIEIAERLSSTTRSQATEMRIRYLYTVRCGLVDMRHFYQLMYVGLTMGNASAVHQGREHELEAEASSRFAPEDTVSNALGALFGSQQSSLERVDAFLGNLRTYLARCGPADWGRMPVSEQDTVVDYYDARDAAGVPVHQNETAMPAPPVRTTAAAGPTRGIFPFVQSVTDGQWNTYSGIVDEE